MSEPVVIFVSSYDCEGNCVCHVLAEKISFTAVKVKDFKELFNELNRGTQVDLIIFDLPCLYGVSGASIFEIINMISTLTKSGISTHAPAPAVLDALNQLVKLQLDIVRADLEKNWPSKLLQSEKLKTLVTDIADLFASGLIEQFPQKFFQQT